MKTRVVFFEKVKFGEKFCFLHLNEEEPESWCVKAGDSTYVDPISGRVGDIEQEAMSRFSTQVLIAETTLTEQDLQQFLDMLTGGELPAGMRMGQQPKLSAQEAFGVIWYLQEHLRLLPDRFEMCHVCHSIFDSFEAGNCAGDEYDLWYQEQGVSQELVEAHSGKCFCSETCESKFWSAVLSEGGEHE